MNNRTRWLILVLVLGVAGVVALWPRDRSPEPPPTSNRDCTVNGVPVVAAM